MTEQNRVLVLDKNRKPLMPCHPARARELLRKGKASVFRSFPFTIILKDREGGDTQPMNIKIDPGSKQTGLVVVSYGKNGAKVIFATEIEHRGWLIKKKLDSRRAALRRGRRGRKTRCRKARFSNRKRAKGWFPPSLMSRVFNIETWVNRLTRFSPITGLSMELVKFDMQKMQNPEVSGIEYQQGELQGYEVREYLLEKWGRKCTYCGAEGVPLEIEHIKPRSKGGSNRVSNLTLSCRRCNQKKGNRPIEDFLKGKPALLKKIMGQTKRPLKDSAAVNATRWKLFETLKGFGLPIETGSGALTKMNRIRMDYPKAHWIDASSVGQSGLGVDLNPDMQILTIKAMGHGSRQMARTDKYGFPKVHKARLKHRFGFQTGDICSANIPKGKYAGFYPIGRIVAKKGSFLFSPPGCKSADRISLSHKCLHVLHKTDGYSYAFS